MGGLGHYLEGAGVATTSISLVREQTERIKPPRALWVPFELGRPFGPPNDPDFQRDVLRAALGLLARPEGPVLADYPHEAPAGTADEAPWACALPLPPQPPPDTEAEALRAQLLAEAALLHPWYDEAGRRTGRTSVGVSGLGASDLVAMVEPLLALATGGAPAAPAGTDLPDMPVGLRYLTDDLKAFYFEAAAAQPGPRPSSHNLSDWLFGETVLGDVLYRARDILAAREDQGSRRTAGVLVPGAYRERPAAVRG